MSHTSPGRKGAAIAVAAIIGAVGLLAPSASAASVSVIGSKKSGPFVEVALGTPTPTCPAGFGIGKAGKNIKNAPFLNWDLTSAGSKNVTKGTLLCVRSKKGAMSGTTVVNPGAGIKTGKFDIPVKGGVVSGVPKDLVTTQKGKYVITVRDMQEFARQIEGAQIDPQLRLPAIPVPSGQPLVHAEIPDYVDLLSIENGPDGKPWGTWRVVGGKGLADGGEGKLVRLGDVITIKQPLYIKETFSNGLTSVSIFPVAIHDYGQGSLPTALLMGSNWIAPYFDGHNYTKTGDSLSPGSNKDHQAAVNLATMQVWGNVDASGRVVQN